MGGGAGSGGLRNSHSMTLGCGWGLERRFKGDQFGGSNYANGCSFSGPLPEVANRSKLWLGGYIQRGCCEFVPLPGKDRGPS
jgi:hypothetical protein